jgi:hypothetical protein
MRQKVDRQKLYQFLYALAAEAERDVKVYLTGGATAVILGWRQTTIDVDLRLIPESDRMLRSIPSLKERLNINVELASPADFIPEAPGWESRSDFILQQGKVAIYHYDYYAQALSKIERYHERDILDVREMLERNLIDAGRLKELFEAIMPDLYRFPAIDPESFRRNLGLILSEQP